MEIEENQFSVSAFVPGSCHLVKLSGADVAVFNVGGAFFATQSRCTHAGGPLCKGQLSGDIVQCPIHGARFNVTNGQVVRSPAQKPLQMYLVTIDGDVGSVESAQ